MKTATEILEDLSCPECEAFHGERGYQLLLAQAKSELRELISKLPTFKVDNISADLIDISDVLKLLEGK